MHPFRAVVKPDLSKYLSALSSTGLGKLFIEEVPLAGHGLEYRRTYREFSTENYRGWHERIENYSNVSKVGLNLLDVEPADVSVFGSISVNCLKL